MLWSKKSAPTHEKARAVGLDLTASRVRAVAVGTKARSLLLDEPAEELPLFIACDRRTPEVGHAAYSMCRTAAHVVYSNFLPALGQSREWRGGRHVLTAEAALELTLAKVRGVVAAESDAIALLLPPYLAPNQVAKTVLVAARAKLPLKGTASSALALAAERAATVLTGRPAAGVTPADGVVPMRPSAGGPGSAVVIDVDEFALSACVVGIARDHARVAASACWPRLGVKVWKEKLLDAVADRCVRMCRRDPRDSAAAEQALFEQLDDALDRARAGQRVSLSVRTAHWYQDVVQQPDEFDGYCGSLARPAAEAIRELIAGAGLPLPPRVVWLTHAAGRLPGLVKAVHQHTHEGTVIDVLSPTAAAHTAALLVPRWMSGELPRQHLDTTMPIPPLAVQPAEPKAGTRR